MPVHGKAHTSKGTATSRANRLTNTQNATARSGGKTLSGKKKGLKKTPRLAHGGTVTGARSQSSIVSPGRSGPVSQRSGTALQRNIPGALNSNRTLGDALRGAGLPTRPQGLKHGGTVTGGGVAGKSKTHQTKPKKAVFNKGQTKKNLPELKHGGTVKKVKGRKALNKGRVKKATVPGLAHGGTVHKAPKGKATGLSKISRRSKKSFK